MSAAPISDIAFSPSVKAMQARLGSREAYARADIAGGWNDRVTPELAAFVAARDSFYLASVNAEGQPYIQHRGGPPGFLRVLDDKTLGIADYRGNRQFITLGNLEDNDRIAIFLMDYPNRQRIKIWGRGRVVENDPALLERLAVPGYRARPERALLFTIEAWDVNCPQHIVPRYTEDQVVQASEGLLRKIAELEGEVESLRRRLGESGGGSESSGPT